MPAVGSIRTELLAVDGTRIKAVNNKDRNFTRGALAKFIAAADERLADYLKRMDQGDADESSAGHGSRGAGKLSGEIAAIQGKREKHCGSVALWLPDGILLPNDQTPLGEVLRTGPPR